MPKRHLFVMDPIDKINPSTDSTYDIMLECQARGYEVWESSINRIFAIGSEGYAFARCLQLDDPTKSTSRVTYSVKKDEKTRFEDFDFIWMRKDPPVDEEFLVALHLLSCQGKAKVLNAPGGLLRANEKMWALQYASSFMPKTLVSSDQKLLYETAYDFGKVVVKPLFQAGGAGVMVFDCRDRNLKSALGLLTNDGKRNAMLQKYIEGAELGDKRIILVGGKPVGAMLRVPSEDDFRANLHVGGQGLKSEITKEEYKLCAHLEPHLLSHGLYLVGIDVINGYLTEVNVTSPTGLQEIDRLDQNKGDLRIRSRLLNWIEENLINS